MSSIERTYQSRGVSNSDSHMGESLSFLQGETKVQGLNRDLALPEGLDYYAPHHFGEPLRLYDVIQSCAGDLPMVAASNSTHVDASVEIFIGDDIASLPPTTPIVAFVEGQGDFSRLHPEQHPLVKIKRTLDSWKKILDDDIQVTERATHKSSRQAAEILITDVFKDLGPHRTIQLFRSWKRNSKPFAEKAGNKKSDPMARNSRLGAILSRIDLTNLLAQNKTFENLVASVPSTFPPEYYKTSYYRDFIAGMLLLLVESGTEYTESYKEIFNNPDFIINSLPRLERYVRNSIARFIYKDIHKRDYPYRTIDRSILPVLDQFVQGNSASQILRKYGIPDSAGMREELLNVVGQFSFENPSNMLSLSRSMILASQTPEGVVHSVDRFIEELYRYTQDRNAGKGEIKDSRKFAMFWSSLTQEDKEAIVVVASQKGGSVKIAQNYGLNIDNVRDFFKAFYRYDRSDMDIYNSNPWEAPEHTWTYNAEREVEYFMHILREVNNNSLLSYILPERSKKIIEYMNAYISEKKEYPDKSHTEIVATIGKRYAYSKIFMSRMHRKSNIFCDLIDRILQLPESKRWDNPIVKGWAVLNFVDYARSRLNGMAR